MLVLLVVVGFSLLCMQVVVANVGRGWGGMVYTHHQKTVVMDQGGAVVSYLGGIDLTDGRCLGPPVPPPQV